MVAGLRIAMRTELAVAALGIMALVASAQLVAQIVPTGPQNRAANQPQAVAYLFPEQVTVAAGKPSPVALHFRVTAGLHINSHTPSGDSLIATVFSIPAGSGVRLDAASYPPGAAIALPLDPKTKLSVYTGDFVVQARIVTVPGNHLVQGTLRYQACDNRECMPPRTITVPIDVIGR
jgi:hypothetical protein